MSVFPRCYGKSHYRWLEHAIIVEEVVHDKGDNWEEPEKYSWREVGFYDEMNINPLVENLYNTKKQLELLELEEKK